MPRDPRPVIIFIVTTLWVLLAFAFFGISQLPAQVIHRNAPVIPTWQPGVFATVVPDSLMPVGRAGVGDVVSAAEVTTRYVAPAPYRALWERVGKQCLGLVVVPPLDDWAWYSVDAKAFTSIWTGDMLIIGLTNGPSHRIWVVHRAIAGTGTVAHEMLHAMLYALGREWTAVHPSDERRTPPNATDKIFAACGLWPVPTSW